MFGSRMYDVRSAAATRLTIVNLYFRLLLLSHLFLIALNVWKDALK